MIRGARASSKSAPSSAPPGAPVASHASVAASAYHPPRGLLSIAASANRSPNLQMGCDARYNFYHQAQFLLSPARFLLNPALTELVAVATDDGAPVDDDSPMGAVLAPVVRYRFLHHTAVSFVSSDITVF